VDVVTIFRQRDGPQSGDQEQRRDEHDVAFPQVPVPQGGSFDPGAGLAPGRRGCEDPASRLGTRFGAATVTYGGVTSTCPPSRGILTLATPVRSRALGRTRPGRY